MAYAMEQLDDQKVAFCIRGAIVHKWVTKQTAYFYNNGQEQFPLQNSFSLTIHKTQGLTLPNVTLALGQ